MKRAVAACLMASAAALPGCQAETPKEPERGARRPPEPACERARRSLNRQGRDGSFLYEETGAAMIDRENWLRLNEGGRDRLIEQLAVVAGCAAATPQREVEITIRAETGEVLTRRRVVPSTDFRTGAD